MLVQITRLFISYYEHLTWEIIKLFHNINMQLKQRSRDHHLSYLAYHINLVY